MDAFFVQVVFVFLVVIFINTFFSFHTLPNTHLTNRASIHGFTVFLFIHIITYCGFNSDFDVLFILEDVENTMLKGLMIGAFCGHTILCYLFSILSTSYMKFLDINIIFFSFLF